MANVMLPCCLLSTLVMSITAQAQHLAEPRTPTNDVLVGGGESQTAGNGLRQRSLRHVSDDAAAVFAAPPAGASTTTTHHESNVAAPIPDPGIVTSTIVVSGVGTKIWDVDATTFITHDLCTDLVVTLISPSGTRVVLTSGNGYDAIHDNEAWDVFDGTLWDDQAPQPSRNVTDYLFFTGGQTATPLVPDAALSRFIGEDPNGVWTLEVLDTLGIGSGNLSGWSLDITTLDADLATTSVFKTYSGPVSITNNNTIHLLIMVSGADTYLCDVDVQTFITHTGCGWLEIQLKSPRNTVVTLSSFNGGLFNDLFNGTVWDDSASVPVTDAAYVNGAVAPWLVPEGALGGLIGENPNGRWELTISQSFSSADSGLLNSWNLTLTSCTVVAEPGEPYCFGDGADPLLTAQCPCANFGDPGRGCANSNGVLGGGRLYASGTTTPNTVLLTCDGIPNGALATFMRGPNHNVQGAVFGDGIKCLTSPLFRFGSQNAGTIGNPPNTVGVGALSEIAGSTIHYVVQYRNSVPGFCAPETFNASNGYSISW